MRRKNEILATSLVEHFFKIFCKTNHQEFPNLNYLLPIGIIGVQSAKLGFESTARKVLELISANDFDKIKRGEDTSFHYFLGPEFETIDSIQMEASGRGWDEVAELCILYRKTIFEYIRKRKPRK